ncbi:MAG: type II toxin-antitoxin system YafQ family toxin [Bacteroidetes bacterium]|nr:type II toxin-antitoxin system YafQ family toxin [Bacteroidota bacterium]
MANHRECHNSGNFLLIYHVDDSPKLSGSVNFVRTRTHSELFNDLVQLPPACLSMI